jgi:hypothetical protein
MSNLTGLVLDAYDDYDGSILRSVMPSEDIPEFVKTAQWLRTDSDNVPDDNYALVLVKEGQKLKKYATVDKGNTALSVLYLLKQAHLLPPKAVKVAALNLLEACQRYNLDAPEQLKLAAKTGYSGVSGESQRPYDVKSLSPKPQQFPVPNPEKENLENPQLGKGGTEEDVHKRTNYEGVQSTNFQEIPPFSTKERFSNSEGSGIDREKLAAADLSTMALLNSPNIDTRHQNWRVSPYVGMEDWEPGYDLEKKASAPSRTLLGGKYPVDSYDQVKTAEVYFEEYTRRFHPRDRRTYCVKLASRMEELGMEVPELIEKYASPGYGADVEAYVSFRRGFVHEEFHPALDLLLEKRAQVNPETFAEALCDFDQITNLNWEWDSNIPDPWASTFGPSLEKVAEKSWTWDCNGVRIDESHLKNLSMNGRPLMIKSFGEKFADEFAKDPKTFFKALPKPNQMVVARMAMDHTSGTGTE